MLDFYSDFRMPMNVDIYSKLKLCSAHTMADLSGNALREITQWSLTCSVKMWQDQHK